MPRVVEQPEWVGVEKGVKQRVRALEAFLSDIYGAQRAIADGVIPASLVTSSSHFHRQAAGIVQGMIRVAVGLEHIDDLKADLARGLDSLIA